MSDITGGIRRPLQRRAATAASAVAFVAVWLAAAGAGAADNPFPTLVGAWSGSAQAILDDGKSEAMRCKAYYTGQGNDGLGIAIRCANASAKIDLRATLTYTNGAVTGQWEERTYNASGSVSGKASADKVDISITGGGLTGAMAVTINGASQQVRIKTEGSGLKGVNISLTRS